MMFKVDRSNVPVECVAQKKIEFSKMGHMTRLVGEIRNQH